MDKTIITTERLFFREFTINDAEDLYQLNADPEVLRYTGDPPFDSIQAAEQFILNYDHYQKYGYGRWAVILTNENRFIGWCGLKFHHEDFIDIGFRFFRKDWGKGYATESAKACIDYGFRQLALNKIIGRAAIANVASVKVLEKIGLKYWKQDTCKGIENAVYYQLTKEEYIIK